MQEHRTTSEEFNTKKRFKTSRRGKQQANLRKKGVFHFQIGLVIALLLVFAGLEASFSLASSPVSPEASVEWPVIYESELPPVNQEIQPDKRMPAPTVVRDPVIRDIEPASPAEVIEVPDDPDENANLPLSSIPFEKVEEKEEIPFSLVEEPPVFPGCENVKNEDRLACFEKKINELIRKNFRYPRHEEAAGREGRVYITFKIDTDGKITRLMVKGPTEGFEAEARRLMNLLPPMSPGKQHGVPVRVPFSLPIHFALDH